jgi:hypothetical protein
MAFEANAEEIGYIRTQLYAFTLVSDLQQIWIVIIVYSSIYVGH